MLRDRDGAAGCVHGALCAAATRLTQLREPDKLRPRPRAITGNDALRRTRIPLSKGFTPVQSADDDPAHQTRA